MFNVIILLLFSAAIMVAVNFAIYVHGRSIVIKQDDGHLIIINGTVYDCKCWRNAFNCSTGFTVGDTEDLWLKSVYDRHYANEYIGEKDENIITVSDKRPESELDDMYILGPRI